MTDHTLTESVLVSLNGVVSEPHTWVGEHFSARSVERSLAALRQSSAMLMGRGTYDVFAQFWPHGSGEYADFINAMPKYVFSGTLTDPKWRNTTVVRGDVVDNVRALKETGNLIVYGHGRFGQTLCDAGLVDELTLTFIPVFVAEGKPFFRPGGAHDWELTGTAQPEPGVIAATYRPVRP